MKSKHADTKDKFRYSRVKCTGEVPSCERCLLKGKQCGGYHTSTSMKRQDRVSVARDNNRNLLAGVPLQSLEQYGTIYQILAPRNDAWTLPVNQGLQQNFTTNCSTLTKEVRNYAMDFPVQYPVQSCALSTQACNLQDDEAGSRDRKALREHERMACLRRQIRE